MERSSTAASVRGWGGGTPIAMRTGLLLPTNDRVLATGFNGLVTVGMKARVVVVAMETNKKAICCCGRLMAVCLVLFAKMK